VSGGFLYRTKGTEMRTYKNSPFQVKYEVRGGVRGWWLSRNDGNGLLGKEDSALACSYDNETMAERARSHFLAMWINGEMN